MRTFDLARLGAALILQAERDLRTGGELASEAWQWIFLSADEPVAGWTAEDAAGIAGVSLREVRRGLVTQGYGFPRMGALRVPAVLVPHATRNRQPGWIRCRCCHQVAPVQDIWRALSCRTCGGRAPDLYQQRRERAATG